MKTGHEYLEQLPKHIGEQLKANVLKQHKSLDKIDAEYYALHEFITGVMTWSTCNEKEQYWLRIYQLCESNHKKKEPLDFTEVYHQYPDHSKRDEVNNIYSIY